MILTIKALTAKFAGTKCKLLVSFGFILILSILIVLMANNGARRSAESYRRFTDAYQLLSEFYRNIEFAESCAKSYLYDRTGRQLDEYNQALESAQNNLDQLYNTVEEETMRKEYQELENMVATYNDLFDDIVTGRSSITDSYGFFNRLPGNIQATYIQYVEMISTEMKETYQQIDEQMYQQMTFTWAVIAVMLLGAVGGMIISMYSITRPIKRLVKNVEKIKQGQYQIDRVKSSDTQIRMLSQAITEMAVSIEDNIVFMEERITLEKMLLIQENENLKIGKTLMETELKVLQSQMNPHFLFNTLNLISKMAYLEQAPKTSMLMEKTSDLLRYSLEKSTSAANLLEEIESIKNYIEIQMLRMGHRITFQLSIEENLPKILMQGMIIQPIVENAVVHGVSDMMEGAQITLAVTSSQKEIIIRVEDNGKGISSNVIEQILSDQDEPVEGNMVEKTSIGIRNVRKRLEMFYGTDGMLNIESSENCGTVVTIKIPITEEEAACIG